MGLFKDIKKSFSLKKGIDSAVEEGMIRNLSKMSEASSGANRDPAKVTIAKVGQVVKASGSGDFEDNPVDLEEMQKAYYTDSYIRRAIDKHAGLMFKNGWDFNGPDEAKTEYMSTRFKVFEETTGTSMGELFSKAAFDYVLYGNAFLIKARADNKLYSQYDGLDLVGYTNKQPIAGYFLLSPTSIKVSRDDNGGILGYEQDTGSGDTLTIAKEDMVHLTYRAPTGQAYGVPFAYNVLDDVQILRQLEENVARLVYRNLFPLYQYKVGIDKPGYEATQEELDDLKETISGMPMDGALVVPERHDIKVVGAEGNAINAEPYLKYYRQRVFTGLGVSDSVMGIGDSSNKSTSDNQEADLFDTVKEFQRIFSEQVQTLIINELLFEAQYDPILNIEDEVLFYFEEIELDAKTKIENHAVQLFMQNAIGHSEMRAQLGLDPLTDQSDLYLNMVTLPTLLASSTDTSTTTDGGDDGGGGGSTDSSGKDDQQSGASNTAANNVDPQNQHSEENSKKVGFVENNQEKVLTNGDGMVNLNSELQLESYKNDMQTMWSNLVSDVVEMVSNNKSSNDIQTFSTELIRRMFKSKNETYLKKAMENAYSKVTLKKIPQFLVARTLKESNTYIDNVINDINREIEKFNETENLSERISKTVGLFNSTKNRFIGIGKTGMYNAYNKAFFYASKNEGATHLIVETGETSCKKCQELEGKVIDLKEADAEKMLPPHHTNCECIVSLYSTSSTKEEK